MTELVRMHIRTAQNNNNVPYAYAAVEEEGMHRALISAGFELWGLSQGTNHLKHRTSRREEKPDIMDLPYSHNAVWFNPMAVAKPYRHR